MSTNQHHRNIMLNKQVLSDMGVSLNCYKSDENDQPVLDKDGFLITDLNSPCKLNLEEIVTFVDQNSKIVKEMPSIVKIDVVNFLNGAMKLMSGVNSSEVIEGPAGKDGINGRDGKDGTNGIDGKDGIQGPKGDTGLQGLTGANGKDGINGVNGLDGKDGIDGKDGVNGLDGKQGPIGLTGPKGTDGLNPVGAVLYGDTVLMNYGSAGAMKGGIIEHTATQDYTFDEVITSMFGIL